MKFKDYMKKYGLRFGIALAVVLLAALLLKASFQGRANAVSNSLNEISQPVDKATFSITQWLENLYGYLFKYDSLVEENNALRAKVSELQAQERDYDEIKAENDRLRQLLNLQEKRSDFTYETAKLVSWDASSYTSAFTISKGSSSGIEAGDCVVTEYGALVGQITEVGTSWATVRTVIDVNTQIGIRIGSAGGNGILDGEYSLMRQGQARIAYYSSGTQALTGDEVITSGSGGTVPSGLSVGTIAEVMSEAGGQTTYSIVTPACDFDTLSQVFIITDYDIVD